MKSTMSTSNMIVPEVLATRNNYGVWKTYMKIYLEGQGLWDIVNGVERKPEDTTTPEFKTWREKNGKALHAILISCEEEILSLIKEMDSAKDVWDRLIEMFQRELTYKFVKVDKIAGDSDNATRNRALYKAVFWVDWETTEALLNENLVESLTATISPAGGTALHMAVATGHLHIVEKLVELMSPEAILATTTHPESFNLTPLHYAARTGFTKIAEVLVKKNNYALRIRGTKFGLIPVALASCLGQKATTRYLYAVTPKESLIEGDCKNGALLLTTAIAFDMYDIAIDLLGLYPQLAFVHDILGLTTIQALAQCPNAFPSGVHNTRQQWIYTCAPIYNERDISSPDVGDTNKDHFIIEGSRSLYGVFWSALDLIVPGFKSIHSRKRIHVQALEVLKCICCQLSTKSEREFEKIGVYDGLFTATKLGIVEIVKELLKINPKLLFIPNEKYQTIFSVAIQCRQEKIFNLIREMDGRVALISNEKDDDGNTILHQAGKSPLFSHEQDEMPGAALQMQRELQWFQEVEKLVPFAREGRNSKGLKPQDVFTEEHKELVKEGEKWMKDTANSCMVVATLIAAFTFSAAFTAPGGSNQESGFPIFLRHKVFLLFIISDALSLFSSSTSLLMFLSIYTSRYAEKDFLRSLPKRLIIGLSTLFFSIATMMVAFCATLFLILTKQYIWLAIPITFLASVPVTLFVLLQFPLFLDMVLSTYRPGLFNRPKENITLHCRT